jgi:hypothetical protein
MARMSTRRLSPDHGLVLHAAHCRVVTCVCPACFPGGVWVLSRALCAIICAHAGGRVPGAQLAWNGVFCPRLRCSGDLLTVFKHKPFDEVRRLGVTPTHEAAVREAFARETGMLVVDTVRCLRCRTVPHCMCVLVHGLCVRLLLLASSKSPPCGNARPANQPSIARAHTHLTQAAPSLFSISALLLPPRTRTSPTNVALSCVCTP